MTMNTKIEKSDLDHQHEKVFLRDAKFFFNLDKIIDKLEDSSLVSKPANLYQLTQLTVKQLLAELTRSEVEKLQFAMKKWHCRPKNFLEPSDITYYDNTGHYFYYDNYDNKRYPEQ